MESLHTAANIPSLHVTNNFLDLAESTQQRRAQALRKLYKSMAIYYAPIGHEYLMKMASANLRDRTNMWNSQSSFYNKVYNNTLELYKKALKVIEEANLAFSLATTTRQKIEFLSILCPHIPYKVLSEAIPGVTKYLFRLARRYARKTMPWSTEKPNICRERFDRSKVDSFLEFITSPMIAQELPTGHIKTKNSRGEIFMLPNVHAS